MRRLAKLCRVRSTQVLTSAHTCVPSWQQHRPFTRASGTSAFLKDQHFLGTSTFKILERPGADAACNTPVSKLNRSADVASHKCVNPFRVLIAFTRNRLVECTNTGHAYMIACRTEVGEQCMRTSVAKPARINLIFSQRLGNTTSDEFACGMPSREIAGVM